MRSGPPGANPGRYLNDGDNDPSSDNDPDDVNGKTVDDDHDEPEDKFNPQNDRYHDKDDAQALSFGHAGEWKPAGVSGTDPGESNR